MQSDTPRPVAGSSPARADEPYRPLRDPQVLILVLIVVGTFAVMVGGLGTGPPFGDDNSSDGPVFPVYDYDGDDPPEPDAVSLSANRTVVDPGESIEFVVTARDRPVANATVTVGGRSIETDRNGTVVLPFDDPGDYTATVDESNDGSGVVRRTVRVRRDVVALSASADATDVVTEEPVRVTLTRADTGEPVTGRVVVDGRTVETDDSGVATLRFDAAGGYELHVEKEPTERERFEQVRIPVTVDRRPVGLRVTLSSNRTRVDESVTATVRRPDTGEPVNASVTFRNDSVRTGSNGTVSLAANASGTYEVRATAPRTDAVRFTEGSASLRVRPRLVGLDLGVNRSPVPAGERVTFTITRVGSGEPVAGTVELFGTRYRTDEDGRLTVAFQRPGEVEAVARAPETPRERFLAERTNLTVRGAAYVVTGLDAPTSAAVDENVTVSATVTNEGNAREAATASYRVGGTTLDARAVDLAPGESTRVEFVVPVPDLAPGEYVQTVAVGDRGVDAALTVTGNGSVRAGAFAGSDARPVVPGVYLPAADTTGDGCDRSCGRHRRTRWGSFPEGDVLRSPF